MHLSLVVSICALVAALATPGIASARAIDQVMQPATIGMNLTYFERLVGPAQRSDPYGHLFIIDNCNVTVTTEPSGKSIAAVKIEASPSCVVDLSHVLKLSNPVPLSRLSFGQFEKLLAPASFYADCLVACGNAYNPSVYLHHEGPRALDFMEFRVGAQMVDQPTIQAADRWQSAMSKRESAGWIMDGLFNCNPASYHAAASQAFRNVRVQSFSFGHGLANSLTAPCSGPTSQQQKPAFYSLKDAMDDYYNVERQDEAKAILEKVLSTPSPFLDDCKKAEVPFAMELGGLSFDEAVERADEVCASMLAEYALCATRDQAQAVACIIEAMGEGE